MLLTLITDRLDAVNYAYKNEVIVVASAGYYGSTQLLYPARYEQCISVGTKDSCDLSNNVISRETF